MKQGNQTEWISTGKAAHLLGYCRDHFRRKFEGLIPSRKLGSGHLRWLSSAVATIAGEASDNAAGSDTAEPTVEPIKRSEKE